MKKPTKRAIIALLCLCAALSPIAHITQTNPAQAEEFSSIATNNLLKSNATDKFYQEAKKVLPSDWYIVYRIVDKISRANGLDEHPWRIRVIPQYQVNAFASEINALTFFDGLLDQLHGDYDALACVIGHEMAHHTRNHIAIGEAQIAAKLAQLKAEAEAAVLAEEKAAQDQQNTNTALAIGIQVLFGSSNNGILRQVGGTFSEVLQNANVEERQRLQQRVQQIVAERKAQFISEFAAQHHAQEFEADTFGYTYAVKAGFKPEGCERAMEVLNRLAGSQVPSLTHPATPDRITQLQALRRQSPPEALAKEGQTRLARNPQPLRFDFSRDGGSLRIESRYGSQSIDDRLR